MAVLCPETRVRELLAYAQIIIQLAQSHGGTGWLAYDRRFRQQVAAGTPLCWVEINPSLLSATVLGSAPAPGGRNCPLCLSWNHGRVECTLGSLNASGTEPKKASPRYRSYSAPGEYCCRFNSGSCPNSAENCRFLHSCSSCGKTGHPASECNKSPTA
uniref:Cleavage and polyadenylation specificity factor subunit 4 n=1 Tax=Amphimedon queenslandica TaxID=400682 RepID=A0A1X7UES1_AMPQE